MKLRKTSLRSTPGACWRCCGWDCLEAPKPKVILRSREDRLLSPHREMSAVHGRHPSGAQPSMQAAAMASTCPLLPMALPAAEGLHRAAASGSWHVMGLGEKLPWGGGMSVMTSIPLLACSCPFKTHMTFSHQQKENYTSLGSGLKQSSAGGTKCI